jgi:adenylyl-sulfate kinase
MRAYLLDSKFELVPNNLLTSMNNLINLEYDAKCFWLTGLSGAGKSTISSCVSRELRQKGMHIFNLDGDLLRRGLNQDLGYSRNDRRENVRRTAEVAHLMVNYGFIVIVSAISPYNEDRESARKLFKDGQFIEVHVATDLRACIERDPKGLYAKAKRGDIANFTGLDDPYEVPLNPELHIQTVGCTIIECSRQIIDFAWPAQEHAHRFM